MPHARRMGTATVGTVSLLESGVDNESGRLVQPIKFDQPVDATMKRHLEMASYMLADGDMPEVKPSNTPDASFFLEFPAGISATKATALTQLLINELDARLKRRRDYEAFGPALALCSEPDNPHSRGHEQ